MSLENNPVRTPMPDSALNFANKTVKVNEDEFKAYNEAIFPKIKITFNTWNGDNAIFFLRIPIVKGQKKAVPGVAAILQITISGDEHIIWDDARLSGGIQLDINYLNAQRSDDRKKVLGTCTIAIKQDTLLANAGKPMKIQILQQGSGDKFVIEVPALHVNAACLIFDSDKFDIVKTKENNNQSAQKSVKGQGKGFFGMVWLVLRFIIKFTAAIWAISLTLAVIVKLFGK